MWELYEKPEPDNDNLAQVVSLGIIMAITLVAVFLCSLL